MQKDKLYLRVYHNKVANEIASLKDRYLGDLSSVERSFIFQELGIGKYCSTD